MTLSSFVNTLAASLVSWSLVAFDADPVTSAPEGTRLVTAKGDDPGAACEARVIILAPVLGLDSPSGRRLDLPRTAVVIGQVDERAPLPLDLCEIRSIDATTGAIEASAWWIDLAAGDRFDLEPAFEVLGPIADCAATNRLPPAPHVGPQWDARDASKARVQYVAPQPGRYLVTPGGFAGRHHSPWRFARCTEAPLDLRRLDDAGLPSAHTLLVERVGGLDLKTAEAQIAVLWPGTTSIVVPATLSLDQRKSLVEIATREADGTWSTIRLPGCTTRHGGYMELDQRSMIADFDGDGHRDILVDTQIFMGGPERSFTCKPTSRSAISTATERPRSPSRSMPNISTMTPPSR